MYKEFEKKWSIHWFKYILNNPDKPWDYGLLSMNQNITWEIVQANPDKPWNYCSLSINRNITWEIVQANPDIPWSYDDALSMNENITWEIVQANPDIDWDWDDMSKNSMEMGKRRWINQRRLEHIKALQIQKHWRNCSCNPQFKLAQRYLLRLHSSQL